MDDIIERTVHYFRPGKGALWRWSADQDVVEFGTGETITFREELLLLLQYLTDQGFPPLPCVLYILYACHEAPDGIENTMPYQRLHAWTPVAGPDITQLLRVIQGLPAEWRTGARKGLLLQEIFRDAWPAVPPDHARSVLDEFRSGRLDAQALQENPTATYNEVNTDGLRDAARRFPTTASLLLRLRTGLDTLPEVAVSVPELPADDLLRQLLSDPKTEGVARLTQRLVAALHITMHTDAAGDLPLGGYADISTRGDLDRLLLSELAHDDAMLTARLVNNEALYLRREEPPDRVHRQRVILLDTTLLLWGIPRVFAVSAALACTQKLPPHTTAYAVALGGETHAPLDLSGHAGIVHALEQLDGALHCGAALENVIRRGGFDEDADYLLITDEEALLDPGFEARFRTAREQLQFLITVSRQGTLHFYALRNGRRKLLNSATYDLGDLLLKQQKNADTTRVETPPTFLQTHPVPLYFPPVKLSTTPQMAYQTPTAVYCVTHAKRLLYWHDRQHGATELLHHIHGNWYLFFTGEEGFLSMLAFDTTDQQLHYYKFDLKHTTYVHMDLSGQPISAAFLLHNGYICFQGRHGLIGVNCLHARLATDEELKTALALEEVRGHSAIAKTQGRYRYENDTFSLPEMRRFTNVRSNVLQHVRSVVATPEGYLLINKKILRPDGDGTLALRPTQDDKPLESHYEATPGKGCALTENPAVRFYPFHWPNGSRAYGDSRGLLHLESGKAGIPAVTLVLTLDPSVTCWSSDGYVCGSPYFIRDEKLTRLPVDVFYEKYIKRFIDDITQHDRASL
ncbi:hypothetical protein [Dawidia soli]|uniref:Uncharacterized protein n=1 Tax=Dawidia soli TaxID=2782352 RepID=A0AAP2D9Y4_9BACT|nr:hypothetical protein [Dawidia soli]MBT1686775.1 hypothetical protein [Dawidia soli]